MAHIDSLPVDPEPEVPKDLVHRPADLQRTWNLLVDCRFAACESRCNDDEQSQ